MDIQLTNAVPALTMFEIDNDRWAVTLSAPQPDTVATIVTFASKDEAEAFIAQQRGQVS